MDLREVGIITPIRRKLVSPLVFILFWTILLPTPALTISIILIWIGPQRTVETESVRLTPESGEYATVTISDQNYGFLTGSSGNQPISLSINGNTSQFGYMTVESGTLEYTSSAVTTGTRGVVAGTSSSVSSTLDQATLLKWMKGAGADITDPEVIAEADELLATLKAMPQTGMPREVAHFSAAYLTYDFEVPATWFTVLQPITWLIIWIAGIVLFFMNRHHRLRPRANHSRLAD